VSFKPSTSTETQFPIVTPSGTTTNWGTVGNIIPNQGIVYKTGASADGSLAANTVYQLTGNSQQLVGFDSYGNPTAVTGSTFAGSVPSGAILPFAYNVTSGNIPAGWLLCDGATYTVAAYPTLGDLLGNTYGGSTGTFAVPNLKGLFIRGAGTQTVSGVTYTSAAIGTKQGDLFQGHYHTATTTGVVAAFGGQSGIDRSYAGTAGTVTVTLPTTDGTNGAVRFGAETRPVNLAMVYCIKI
jgi:microcystin-dependent protein